jgi:ABC-2 type transport system ATP-binding protein
MGELAGLPSQVALERAHEALFFVGLGEARYRAVDTYSQGMKQMAKLAQALVHGPRVLFLDEPTNGLDPGARQRMLDLVKAIRDRGEISIVLSSHLLKDVESVCDEVVVLKAGRIATVCDLEAERRSNQKFLELELRGGTNHDGEPKASRNVNGHTGDLARVDVNGNFAEAAAALGCECLVHSKRRLKLLLPPQVQVQQLYAIAAQQGVQIRRLQARRDSLEDIFLKAMEERDGGS